MSARGHYFRLVIVKPLQKNPIRHHNIHSTSRRWYIPRDSLLNDFVAPLSLTAILASLTAFDAMRTQFRYITIGTD